MLLTVDVGNSNIVLGLHAGRGGNARLVRDWRMRTDPRMTADEMALTLRGLLGPHADDVTGISALSTVPAVLRELRTMLDRYYAGVPTVIVEPGVRTGVPLLVDNPKEVGGDRLVNTLAAHHLHNTACVVVDFGTSTNVDAISAKGEFLGGAFAPGIDISVDALASRAAALRKVELVRPRSVIGKNTVECLQSGILYGFAGQVDGLVRRIARELTGTPDERVEVIATGGLAPLVLDESETITEHVPHLTLLGLRLVFERNTADRNTAERNERSGRRARP
ncbi:type III pantothenate kinase [Saccharomonospora xinjiangensis]|uniref:type III pantothenate kinase n=1 Tax=Saccharomonospora xinjiangensis TaxID=75294 RepID=UPI00350F2F13